MPYPAWTVGQKVTATLLAAMQPIKATKSVDTARASTTAQTADPHLSLALAANAQFAIWSASGLENALFCLLLAGAVHRTLIEAEEGEKSFFLLNPDNSVGPIMENPDKVVGRKIRVYWKQQKEQLPDGGPPQLVETCTRVEFY